MLYDRPAITLALRGYSFLNLSERQVYDVGEARRASLKRLRIRLLAFRHGPSIEKP